MTAAAPGATDQVWGTALGVPYLAWPPAGGQAAPPVVGWHLIDPPSSDAALAAALPMARLPAWRVYLGLPLTGARSLSGGVRDVQRRASVDAIQFMLEPIPTQAVAKLPWVVRDLRRQLPIDDSPIGLFGGSLGGLTALLGLAEADVPIGAATVVNAVIRLTTVLYAYRISHQLDDRSRATARRLDLIERAADIAARQPQPPLLLATGDQDAPGFLADAADSH